MAWTSKFKPITCLLTTGRVEQDASMLTKMLNKIHLEGNIDKVTIIPLSSTPISHISKIKIPLFFLSLHYINFCSFLNSENWEINILGAPTAIIYVFSNQIKIIIISKGPKSTAKTIHDWSLDYSPYILYWSPLSWFRVNALYW